jgi:hypothetical protein
MTEPALELSNSLEAFFFEQLEDARERSGCGVSQEVEAYLVRLLAEFARRPHVAGRRSAPLALQLMHAREQGPTALRGVGDRALFVAGVVPRSLERTPVNRRYVSSIGETAYRELHRRVRHLTIFEELAEAFETIVEVLGEAMAPADGQPETLLAVYERWRRDGDEKDARTLICAGVLLDPDRSDILQ